MRGWIPYPPHSAALPGARTQSLKCSVAPVIRAAGTGLLAHCWAWQVILISQSKALIKIWIPKLSLYCASNKGGKKHGFFKELLENMKKNTNKAYIYICAIYVYVYN